MTYPTLFLIIKALVSGALIVVITELAKKNNLLAVIVHSLPWISLTTFIWMYLGTRDTALIAQHSFGTFWFVLPTLPLFLILQRLLRTGWNFWAALGAGIVITVILYVVTLRLLKAANVNF